MAAGPGHGSVLLSSDVDVLGVQAVPFEFTIPTGTWKFIYARSDYKSSATPGLRRPFIEVFDPTGASQVIVKIGTSNPSTTRRYVYQCGNTFTTLSGALAQAALPVGLVLLQDWVLKFGASGNAPGDSQIVNFQLDSIQ